MGAEIADVATGQEADETAAAGEGGASSPHLSEERFSLLSEKERILEFTYL